MYAFCTVVIGIDLSACSRGSLSDSIAENKVIESLWRRWSGVIITRRFYSILHRYDVVFAWYLLGANLSQLVYEASMNALREQIERQQNQNEAAEVLIEPKSLDEHDYEVHMNHFLDAIKQLQHTIQYVIDEW